MVEYPSMSSLLDIFWVLLGGCNKDFSKGAGE